MRDSNQVWPFIMSEERQEAICQWHRNENQTINEIMNKEMGPIEEYNRMTGQNIRRTG